ncbi:MAG: hypothetical protein J07HX5_00646 [halophilic archaeon J07HX5]|nr:MAG: hypothetical protein J07HX5_00646 [halophilic archaeon J07HX5]
MIGTNALRYSQSARWVFTIACLIISWGWFLGLATAGWLLGDTIVNDSRLEYLNTLSAAIIWAGALYMMITVFS